MVDYVQLPEADAGISLIELWTYVGDQLAAYMDRLNDEAYLEGVRERRREQARRFNWEMAAHDLLAILDDLD